MKLGELILERHPREVDTITLVRVFGEWMANQLKDMPQPIDADKAARLLAVGVVDAIEKGWR